MGVDHERKEVDKSIDIAQLCDQIRICKLVPKIDSDARVECLFEHEDATLKKIKRDIVQAYTMEFSTVKDNREARSNQVISDLYFIGGGCNGGKNVDILSLQNNKYRKVGGRGENNQFLGDITVFSVDNKVDMPFFKSKSPICCSCFDGVDNIYYLDYYAKLHQVTISTKVCEVLSFVPFASAVGSSLVKHNTKNFLYYFGLENQHMYDIDTKKWSIIPVPNKRTCQYDGVVHVGN
eukprot:gene11189-13036_t